MRGAGSLATARPEFTHVEPADPASANHRARFFAAVCHRGRRTDETRPTLQYEHDAAQGSTGVTQGGVRPSAATLPNTANLQRNSTKGKATGDEDLEDLEVERRTVQGIEKPGSGTVQPRPSAGTSPNVARQVPSPAAAPGPRPYGK